MLYYIRTNRTTSKIDQAIIYVFDRYKTVVYATKTYKPSVYSKLPFKIVNKGDYLYYDLKSDVTHRKF